MIVGVTGKKGHGKDTVGLFLQEQGFKRTAFAQNLKIAAMQIFQLAPQQVFGPISIKEAEDPRWGMTPREIMQKLGTEVGRNIHPDVWVKGTMLALEKENARNVVITDVRFLNEANAVKEAGGIILRVIRPGFGTDEHNEHASETEMDGIEADYEVLNDGPRLALKEKVVALGLQEMK